MTMFMGIVGHLVSLDHGRHQNLPGSNGFHYGQDQVSIYLASDHVSSSAQKIYGYRRMIAVIRACRGARVNYAI